MTTASPETPRSVLVAVVDAARARLFWLTRDDSQAVGSRLIEAEGLVHPDARIKPSDRFSDSLPGGVHPGPSGGAMGYDDHRQANDLEGRRRFAREIGDALARLVAARGPHKLVLLATHAEHSLVLEELERHRLDVAVQHSVGEFSKATPHELLSVLQERGLVPRSAP